ncbi:MAG: LacI family DNA-binding transcriptional regulator [Lentisphaerota bacterium]
MISMADIGKAAKVSRTTVSLVLNDRQVKGVNISEETQNRVKEIARRLGYHNNKLAISVATGKSQIIGCIGMDMNEESSLSVGQLISATVSYATMREYSIKMLSSRSTVEELVNACVSYRMCGVIFRTRDRERFESFAEAMKRYEIPVVLLDSAFTSPTVPSVVCDDYDGMRQVVEYLASLGHRKLTYLTFETFQPFSIRRQKGFVETTEKLVGRVVGTCCDTDNGMPIHVFDRAELIITEILKSADIPDAFVCNCDEIAMVALRAAWRCGIKVPEDLSIIGFGNLPVDALTSPPLTSLALPYERMAEAAIDFVLSGETAARELVVPVSIQIRQSTTMSSKTETKNRKNSSILNNKPASSIKQRGKFYEKKLMLS